MSAKVKRDMNKLLQEFKEKKKDKVRRTRDLEQEIARSINRIDVDEDINVVGSEIINVLSVYAPQIGLPDNIKKLFWEDLDMAIQDVPRSEKIFIGGDFNGHIGVDIEGYDTAHGGFGFGKRNNGGVSVLDFAVAYELLVVNFFSRRRRTT